MVTRNGSLDPPIQGVGEAFAAALDNSIFHGAGPANAASGLNGGGGRVGGGFENSVDRASARDLGNVLFPTSREPRRELPTYTCTDTAPGRI